MKKNLFTLLLITFCLSVVAVAQTPVNWKKAGTEKSDYVTFGVYQDNTGGMHVGFYEMGAMFKINGAYINNFSPEGEFLSKTTLEGNLPEHFEAKIMLDQICIIPAGNMPNSNAHYILFYDFSGKLIKQVDLDAGYKFDIIEGNWASAIINNNYSGIKNYSNLSQTKDGKYYTIWGYKKADNSKNKMDKNNDIKMYAFDKNLEKVAEESFEFEDVFSNSGEINSLSFDISPKNKVVAICSNVSKPDRAQINLAIFNEKGSKPTVHKYTFKYDEASYAYDFGKFDEIYISGIISVGGFRPTLKRTADKTLFFINQTLTGTKTANASTYDMEDKIYNAYTEYNSDLRSNSINPFDIFVTSDGIMYGSMFTYKTTTTTTTSYSSSKSSYWYSKCFTFIKFSFTGKIQWLKMIRKEIKFPETGQKMAGFSYAMDGDKLSVVYADNPANILNKSTKMVRGAYGKLVPALAEISSGGDITFVPLDKLGKVRYFNDPTETYFNGKEIMLLGFTQKMLSRPEYYIGKVTLP